MMAAAEVIVAPLALRTPAVAPKDPSAASAWVSEAAAACADLLTLLADLLPPCADPQDVSMAVAVTAVTEMDTSLAVPRLKCLKSINEYSALSTFVTMA